jgi:hypothetical protein
MKWNSEIIKRGDREYEFETMRWGTWKFRLFRKEGRSEVRLSKFQTPSGLRIYQKILSGFDTLPIPELKQKIVDLLKDM